MAPSFLPDSRHRPNRPTTPLDEEILRGKAEGETGAALAQRLNVSTRTINRRWAALVVDYDLASPLRLARFVRRYHMIDSRTPY